MTRAEKAEALFHQGFSCSQAVLAAFADAGGLDEERALKLGEGLAAGICGLGRTCGAVTGAVLAVGLLHGRTRADDQSAKDATALRVRRLVAAFEQRHGTSECRALLGCDIDTADRRKAARDAGLFQRVCPPLVRSAAELLDAVVAETR